MNKTYWYHNGELVAMQEGFSKQILTFTDATGTHSSQPQYVRDDRNVRVIT